MANHLRRQIRERAASTLTGLSTTGSNVFQTRVYPMESAGLPGLCIYTTDETVELSTIGSIRTLFRRLDLMVEGYAKASANLDDSLDQIAKEVEIAMAADIGLNSLAHDSYLTATENVFSREGEQPIGVIQMSYSVVYESAENAPDVAL